MADARTTSRAIAMADWAGLHEDLLDLVVVRLSSLDLLRFRAVCVSWRTARRGCPHPDRPWLLLPTDVSADLALDRGRLIVCPDREVSVEAWTPSQRAWAA